MTATELQNIARRLSNSCHCRHWLNFFNSRTDVMMAIQCVDYLPNGFAPISVRDLERLGFALFSTGSKNNWIYTIPRTNEDGTPFVSELH